MSLTFNDQAIMAADLGETVTLTGANGTDTYTVTTATREDMSLKEAAASNRVYLSGNNIWTIPEGTYTAVAPGWTITDSGTNVHTVLNATHSDFASFWKLDTVNLTIAASLNDTVAVHHPTFTSDAATGRSASWAAVSGQTSVRCRVQPEMTEVYNEVGKRAAQTLYKVYFATAITPKTASGDFARLVWGSVTLQILSYEQAERIDALPMAECRAVP